MRQRAQVIGTEVGRVLVKLNNPANTCGKCMGCIRLSGEQRSQDQVLALESDVGVAVGDYVIIESKPKALMQAVAILYGIPSAGLVFGYLVTLVVTKSDATGGLGALGGLLIAAILARPIARKAASKVDEPRVVAKAC